MLTRALQVTQEYRAGVRYSVFFPAVNGDLNVRMAGDNVIGALTHLHLDGLKAHSTLEISDRRLPDQGYAAKLFEHGFVSPSQLAEAQQVLHEDEPGRLVTVFVPSEMEHLSRIIYNTLIVCSQSVHGQGGVRITGQKTPGDAAAALLLRAKLLVAESQYKRMLATFCSALADEMEYEQAEGALEHLDLISTTRRRAALSLEEAVKLEADQDVVMLGRA